MPRIQATKVVDVDIWTAFGVSQTTGDIRLRWDPFIRSQHHLGGADIAGPGVRTRTVSKHGLTMTSEYTSFHPPDRVGMKMVDGPWFFERFGGGWVFHALDAERTEATWRYTFTVRPGAIAPIADRLGTRLLDRDIRQRLGAFADGCRDDVVVAAARRLVARWQDERA